MSKNSEIWRKMGSYDPEFIHLSKGRMVSKEQLVDIVNKDMDMYKKFVRPIRKKYKKDKKKSDAMRFYRAYAARCENYIICLLAHLNGISTTEYYTKVGQRKKGLMFKENGLQGKFSNLSYLNWDTVRTYVPYDLEFKLRFVTILLSDMKNQIEEMTKNQMLYKSKKKRTVTRSFELMDQLIDTVNCFIKDYLLSDDYGDSLMRMNNYITYGCSYMKNQKGFNEEVEEVKEWFSDNLVSNGLVDKLLGRVENQDAAIYNLILLSYKVITQSERVDVFPSFKKFRDKSKDDDLRDDIIMLGKEIRKKKKYAKRSIMYKAWNDANPLIYSNYEDVNNKTNLAVGIRALMFTSFLLNDKGIHSFVIDMISKPLPFSISIGLDDEEKEDK